MKRKSKVSWAIGMGGRDGIGLPIPGKPRVDVVARLLVRDGRCHFESWFADANKISKHTQTTGVESILELDNQMAIPFYSQLSRDDAFLT